MSTGTLDLTTSERSILSEWRVARQRIARFDEILIAHRERTGFAEIDLLFEKRGSRQLTLVEVKSWSGDLWGAPLIKHTQLARLRRARSAIEAAKGKQVRLVLAVVGQTGIRYFDLA